MPEDIYNIFLIFEGDSCKSVKYKVHSQTFADDEAAVRFLQAQVNEDLKLAEDFPLSASFTRPEYYSYIRAGHEMGLYDSLFVALNAGPAPLCVTTLVENSEIKITDSSQHGDPNIYLTEKALQGRKMEDWLLKYTANGGIDLPRLVHDDYFLAIKMTFNAKHYVSSMKLLLSCIDSISYIEYGDARRTPFVDWLNAYADLTPLGITAEELWEMRNGMLHMTNLHSRRVRTKQVRRISFRIGGAENSQVDDVYYFQFYGLIQIYGKALGQWFASYNKDHSKFAKFIERYDETISDSRFATSTPASRAAL